MKKVIHFSLIANLLISVLLYGSCSDQNNDLTLTSPNKEHSLKLYNTNGVMQYDFIAFGDTVVKKSQLGFHKLDSFQITDTKVSDYDETWKTVWGANSEIRNHYNQLTVSLIGKSGLKFNLVSRIFDDGVAFRYVFPQQELDSIQLKDFTSFAFLNDHTIWYKGQHRKWKVLADRQDASFLSYGLKSGRFTGTFIGMYATSKGTKSNNFALFDWFEYTGF